MPVCDSESVCLQERAAIGSQEVEWTSTANGGNGRFGTTVTQCRWSGVLDEREVNFCESASLEVL